MTSLNGSSKPFQAYSKIARNQQNMQKPLGFVKQSHVAGLQGTNMHQYAPICTNAIMNIAGATWCHNPDEQHYDDCTNQYGCSGHGPGKTQHASAQA